MVLCSVCERYNGEDETILESAGVKKRSDGDMLFGRGDFCVSEAGGRSGDVCLRYFSSACERRSDVICHQEIALINAQGA